MSNETERNPKQQGKHDPAGPANTSDTTNTPSPGNQSQGRHPQDSSKKNPSQDRDSRHDQEKPEDQKRRAS